MQNPLVVSSGLVGYWSLNEGSGLVARDYSGNGNNGILSGSANLPTWTPGVAGNALSFVSSSTVANGTFVETARPATAQTSNVSLCAWFKTKDYTQPGQIIVHNGSDKSATGYGFAVNSESTTNGQISGLYSGVTWLSTGKLVTDSLWHFGVFVIGPTRIPYYYQDGALAYIGTSFGINMPTLYTDIGRNDYIVTNPTIPRYFNGLIDEVRIYNRVLSQSEITTLYLAT